MLKKLKKCQDGGTIKQWDPFIDYRATKTTTPTSKRNPSLDNPVYPSRPNAATTLLDMTSVPSRAMVSSGKHVNNSLIKLQSLNNPEAAHIYKNNAYLRRKETEGKTTMRQLHGEFNTLLELVQPRAIFIPPLKDLTEKEEWTLRMEYENEKKKRGTAPQGGVQGFNLGGTISDPDPKPKKKYTKPYINDFLVTEADLEFLNKNTNYCPTGECLESAFKAYDKIVGRHKGFPTADAIKNNMEIVSKSTPKFRRPEHPLEHYNTLSSSQKKYYNSIPYMKPEEGDFTADAGDIHGIIKDKGGINLWTAEQVGTPMFDEIGSHIRNVKDAKKWEEKLNYWKNNPEKKKELYDKMTIGTIVGYGDDSYAGDYNMKKGLHTSTHAAIVVGFAEDGVPILYDYNNYYRMDKTAELSAPMYEGQDVDRYPITNISIPKGLEGKTRAELIKNKEFDAYPSDLNLDISELESQSRKGITGYSDTTKFLKTLTEKKVDLMNDLGIDSQTYDRYAELLLAISMQETRGGASKIHKTQEMWAKTAGRTQGLTQLDIENITKDPELKKIADKYGIRSERDLYDVSKSAIASMIYSKRNDIASQKYFEAAKEKEGFSGNRKYYLNNRGNTFTNEGFLTEESKDRVDLTYGVGALSVYRSEEDIQKDLDKKAPGRYKVGKDKDGLYITKKTQGNKATLTKDEAFIYGWQSPYSLATGDARGDSNYVKQILEYKSKIKKKSNK